MPINLEKVTDMFMNNKINSEELILAVRAQNKIQARKIEKLTIDCMDLKNLTKMIKNEWVENGKISELTLENIDKAINGNIIPFQRKDSRC